MIASTHPPQNILVIPLRYIGDTILTVPLLRNLRRLFPAARIDMLTSAVTAPLMEACPYLNSVMIEPKASAERLKLLKAQNYDTVFILRKSATMALLCQLAGIPNRIGYDKQRFPWGYKRWGWFLSHTAQYPSLKTDTPQAVSHLGLLAACGLQAQDSHLELWNTEADEQHITQLIAEHSVDTSQPLAVLHAASASHGKQIELSKFTESLQQLHTHGYQLLATGTQTDRQGYDTLSHEAGVPLINLAGSTSLRETFALYRRIQLLLTVDSSPIHMGAAAGVPHIVGVFGPTNEKQWGPHNPDVNFRPVFVDLPCRPCYAKVCAHNNCRVLLSKEQISEAICQAIKLK
jgi:heptosyltransferase II